MHPLKHVRTGAHRILSASYLEVRCCRITEVSGAVCILLHSRLGTTDRGAEPCQKLGCCSKTSFAAQIASAACQTSEVAPL